MNTILSFRRAALLALALGTASATAAFAQTTNTPSACPPGGGHHHGSVLTPAEKTELKAAYQAAFTANPNLKTDQENLKQQFETLKGEGSSATQADWQALHAQEKTFHQELNAALLQADSNIGPILAKLQAAHKGWHHHHNDSDSDSDSSSS